MMYGACSCRSVAGTVGFGGKGVESPKNPPSSFNLDYDSPAATHDDDVAPTVVCSGLLPVELV